MIKTSFTLAKKKQLTHDVYELTYHLNTPPLGEHMSEFDPKPGQYVMFQLAPGLNRAYSMAGFDKAGFTLIIKRVPEGRGSPMICDAEIGSSLSGMTPLGHFSLKDTMKTKCFLGTGTGFAPLYAMISELDKKKMPIKVHFAFGVRSIQDTFYWEELTKISEKYENFSMSIHTSREQDDLTSYGYVTDLLDETSCIQKFEEFYLCGSPAMVKSAREKLETLGVEKSQIFFEQY